MRIPPVPKGNGFPTYIIMNSSIVVIGGSNIDMIARVARFPRPGETMGNATYHQAYGGKGANQAVAAARAGGQVSLISCVGRDAFGQTMLGNFANEGITADYVRQHDTVPSGTAVILVNEQGENCIAVAPGANGQLMAEHIDEARIAISGAEMILLQLEIPFETVTYVVNLAKSLGKKVLLNPAPARTLSDDLLRQLHILVVNETEAELIAGQPATTAEEVQQVAQTLLQKGPAVVVVTRGAQGAYYATRREQQMVDAYAVSAVDTTAAGDVFCGALAAALARNTKLVEAVRFANAAAALSTTKQGAQPSAPTEAAVKAFLSEREF